MAALSSVAELFYPCCPPNSTCGSKLRGQVVIVFKLYKKSKGGVTSSSVEGIFSGHWRFSF